VGWKLWQPWNNIQIPPLVDGHSSTGARGLF